MVSSISEEKVQSPTPSPESLLTEKIKKVFIVEPHRAYTASDFLRALKIASPKDPEKEAQTLEQVASSLAVCFNEGLIREVAPKLFKTRLFFDSEKNIEQAYIGGMGNARYAFNALVFRLNIGVLSLYFIKNERERNWRVYVSDTTIGKDYSLVRSLNEGVHRFGTNPKSEPKETVWVIEGKYIDVTHVTVILSHDKINVEDHRTLRGTRIDHLTDSGFARYVDVAGAFLRSTDPADQRDTVIRGRFVLQQLLHHHKNFEASFFNKVVDYILIQKRLELL